MQIFLELSAVIILSLTLFSEVQGSRVCAPRDSLIKQIEEKWGEKKIMMAITDTGNLLEIFVNINKGTWTMIETLPSLIKRSCVVGVGDSFEGLFQQDERL